MAGKCFCTSPIPLHLSNGREGVDPAFFVNYCFTLGSEQIDTQGSSRGLLLKIFEIIQIKREEADRELLGFFCCFFYKLC